MKLLKITALALLCCGLPNANANAEITASGKFSFGLPTVNGLVVRDRINIDQEYAVAHNVKVPKPFEFAVPRVKGLLRLVLFPKDLPNGYIKFTYATSDKKFLENIQFDDFTLGIGPIEARQKEIGRYMKDVLWGQLTEGEGASKIDLMRNIKVGELDAVEMIGRYADKNDSENIFLLRAVALMKRDQVEGLFVISNISTKRVEAMNDDQLDATITSDILRSVKYK